MNPNKNEMKIFIGALFKILGVAFVCGICTGIICQTWIAGLSMFIMAIVAQFAINAIVMELASRKNREAEFLAKQVLKEASERQLPYNLNCAYCNELNRIGISFVNENSFECVKCKQPNKVYIQFTTVRITTPLVQKENTTFIDMESDPGVSQSTVNQPISMMSNE
ncbi:MAG: hypothetical protein PHS54_00625 [Clostridia bacterium]|nr:hypothetical protein [Clostridia bacterium]